MTIEQYSQRFNETCDNLIKEAHQKVMTLHKGLFRRLASYEGTIPGESPEPLLVWSGKNGNTGQENPVQMRFDFGPEFES